MSPYENVIIGNSFEEIVFTNRNKAYGAYLLRKKQKSYQITAFFIAFLITASAVIVPLIHNYRKGNTPRFNEGAKITVAEIDTSLRVIIPELPEINLEQAANRFVPPVVVEEVDSSETGMISMDDLIATTTVIAPPQIINEPAPQDPDIEVEQRPFITVEVPATFNGGDLTEFNKWVLQNLKYPQIAIENQISGRVYIQFVVNAKGKVENINVLRGADPALDEEAVRVIKSSPAWTPPMQGGRAVKQLFSLPVTFKLSE